MTRALTPQQAQAMELTQNCFVEAGAGTGKTTVLTARYVAALAQTPDLTVRNILAITFTEKAAAELKSRISATLRDQVNAHPHLQKAVTELFQTMSVGTIHSFCNGVLRRFSYVAGLPPNFELLSDAESEFRRRDLITKALTRWADVADPRFFRYCQALSSAQLGQDISQLLLQRLKLTDAIFTHPHYPPAAQDLLSMAQECRAELESQMAHSGQIDHDFLLSHTRTLLKENANARHYYQNRLRHLMVDEFQDTDPIQWEIIQLLCDDSAYLSAKKLFLVGDFKQSIYQFRGATPDLFFKVRAEFEADPDSLVVGTTLNFRSHNGLMAPLNHLFNGLFSDLPAPFLPLQTPYPTGPTVDYSQVEPIQKSALIAAWIAQTQPSDPSSWSDFAILVRKKRQGELLKTQLGRLGIPCIIAKSGDLFFQEPVIDLAYLTIALLNPADDVAWQRVLGSPLLGLTPDHRYALARALNRAPIITAILNPQSVETWGQAHFPSGISTLVTALSTLNTWLTRRNPQSIWVQIDTLIQTHRLWHRYSGVQSRTLHHFRTYCDFLRRLSERYRFHHHHIISALMHHLENPSLDIGQTDDTPSTDAIPIYTVHSAKGLEFKNVIFADMADRFNLSKTDRILIHAEHGLGLAISGEKDPHREQVVQATEIQIIREEKRLFYVAATRAKSRMLWVGAPETKTPSYQSMLLGIPDIDAQLNRWQPDEAEIARLIRSLPPTAPATISNEKSPSPPIVSREIIPPAPPKPTLSPPRYTLAQRVLHRVIKNPALSNAECVAQVLTESRHPAALFDHEMTALMPIVDRFRHGALFVQLLSVQPVHIAPAIEWQEANGHRHLALDFLFRSGASWTGIQLIPEAPDQLPLPFAARIDLPELGQVELITYAWNSNAS